MQINLKELAVSVINQGEWAVENGSVIVLV